MKFALGWACNLKDLFVRFPYEKCKSIKTNKKAQVGKVFRAGIQAVLDDIIENNVTFKCPGFGYYGGEIHMEPVTGEEFKRVRAKGKFLNIDFLETLFTGYLMYFYIKGKRDNFLARRKFPIYIDNKNKNKLENNINNGKNYC